MIAVSGASLLIAGCASTTRSESGPSIENGAIVTTEFRTVVVTGSRIPIHVPASPTAKPLPSIAPVQTIEGEQALERFLKTQ